MQKLSVLLITLTACDSGGSSPINDDEVMSEVESSGELQKTYQYSISFL